MSDLADEKLIANEASPAATKVPQDAKDVEDEAMEVVEQATERKSSSEAAAATPAADDAEEQQPTNKAATAEAAEAAAGVSGDESDSKQAEVAEEDQQPVPAAPETVEATHKAAEPEPPAEVKPPGMLASLTRGSSDANKQQRTEQPEEPVVAAAAPAKPASRTSSATLKFPAAATAAGADTDREIIKSTQEKEVPPKPSVKVSDLRKQLSGSGASLTGGLAAPTSPSPAKERPPSPALSPHDLVNTTNVAALLQATEFKLKPGVDTVAYEKLVTLRLEDGIDVTRKEEYLSAAEFTKVMGVDKEAFAQLPQWKRLQIKRAVNLF